jgi:filamentous hemagglutinin family protein
MKKLLNIGLTTKIVLSLILFSPSAKAQIIPDDTLPDNSTITPKENIQQIEGGTRAGDNLFHSFAQFSVPAEQTAAFNNGADITNIFSRVTGNSISEIEGKIQANGSANLLLINPNGILFGENASLDIGGSFLGSTADKIIFPDGVEFSAIDTQTTPLLIITAPIGLGFRDNPGDIVNRSTVQDSAEEVIGLEVNPGNNLTFVASNLNFEDGSLTASGGDIYLGAISESGTVEISENGSLSIAEDISRGDITLNNGSEVDVRGSGGGNIKIDVRNLNMEGGELEFSSIKAGIREESTAIEAQAGDITIDATGSLSLNEGEITNNVDLEGFGNSGNVFITTDSLSLLNGSLIATITRGQGNAGVVNVTAIGDIIADGEGDIIIADGEDSFILARASGITSRVFPEGVGNSGGVTVSTNNLTLTAGGRVDAGTGGQGNPGAVNVMATGDINIDGELSRGIPSGITSRINPDSVGNSGGVTVSTNNLTLTNGGRVDASTASQGNAGAVNVTATGDINIDGELSSRGTPSGITSRVDSDAVGDAGGVKISTTNLNLTAGGSVSASTEGQGNANNVTIEATESITINGFIESFRSGISANALNQNGNGGDVFINTGKLSVANGGAVEATNFDNIGEQNPGTGRPGNINIAADTIELTDNARIETATQFAGGESGIIDLQVAENIILRNNSQITTNASESATGGDISIDSEGIALLDGSNITANAVEGRGGNIDITTQGIFQESDTAITASSQLGIDGTVTLNTPDVDPTSGIYKLPDAPIDAENILAQDLCKLEDEKIAKGSSFIITGRGGLTPTSADSLSDIDNVVNWANREDLEVSQNGAVGIRQREANSSAKDSANTSYPNIQQSQGLVVAKDGSAWLTANAYNTASNNSGITHPDCRHK